MIKRILLLIFLIIVSLNASPPQLQNFDVSCYFNSLLQALNATPEFTNFILKANYPESSLGDALKKALLTFQSSSPETIKVALNNLYQKITVDFFSRTEGVSCRQEQDAEEFLTHLINILDPTRKIFEKIGYAMDTFLVESNFRTKTEPYNLVLSIPAYQEIAKEKKSITTLYQGLDLFIQPSLTDYAGVANVAQKHVLSNLSDVLIVQLKRSYVEIIKDPATNFVNALPQKISSSIKIPFQLDLKKYVVNDYQQPTQYILYAAILHRGTGTTGGHYIAYVREGNTWYYCNDDQVYPVDRNFSLQYEGGKILTMDFMLQDINQSGYIFFYRNTRTEISIQPNLDELLNQLRNQLHQLNQLLKV